MRNQKWLHVSMVLVLLLSLVSPLTISKTHAQNKLSQVSLTETENGIMLSWEALLPQDEEITSYQLSKNGQANEIEPTVQNGNHYSYEDPEIEPNTTYSYEISAVTSSGNLLTSEKVEYPSKGTSEENTGEAELAGEQAETMGPAETTEPEEATEQDEAETATETLESAEASELTAAADETVTTNIKVSTKNGNIPWDYFSFTIIGVSENVTDIEYYGYLNEEGYFVEYESDSENLELPIGTYKLVTYNDSIEEEITAEFKVEGNQDYLSNPIEIVLDDEKLIIKKELYVEGVTEQSISIYWEEPWGGIDIEKYHVYLNGKLIEEITDPYSTTYTYNDLLQETTYQLKVDIFYMDGTIETIEAEATTTPLPVGEKVQFKDENLKTAVADALKIYHREVYVDDMERLTSLEASYLEIKDLTGLEYATNLVDLSLSGNEIKGLAPIKNLKNLSYLDLEANQITSIINLSNLENLDSIFLANNELEDIKALLELPNLTHASVYGNPGLDFTKGSEDMAVVKELFENGVYVEWSDLEHELLVTDVTESTVDFEFNFIEVVDNIKKYIIYVNGEEVTETHVSKPFYKLTGLDPLSDIDIMVEGVDEDGFVWGSVYTYVTTTPIPSGEPVQFVDSALEEAVRETLHIKSRAIVESDMSILPSLDAMNRGITDLTGLEYATNLEELHLDSNAITNLEPLKGLTNLAYLSLYENKVKDISALENLNIEFLNLGSNEITDISSLLTLENLGFVLIMKNPLDFNEGSETLKVIKELEQKEIFVLYEYLDITAHHVSDSEIELSWEAFTTDGFEDFSYMVFVDGEIVAEDIKDTTFLLTDLEADTEYSIEVVGFDENAERLIFGTTVVTTAAAGEEPVDEPGDETDPEEGETPEEQPVDDKDEVTTPGKNTGKGNTPKETNDKSQDKTIDKKKNDDKKLPTTATNSYNILLFGLLLLVAGIIAIIANRWVTGTGPSSHR